MRRILVVPAVSSALVAFVVVGAAVASAVPAGGQHVAKTTIGGPTPTAPVPSVPVPTVPIPTAVAPLPTVGGPTTTEVSGLSPESLAIALPLFGFDAAKLQCVDTALPPFTDDDAVALAALQGCGAALMPLLRGIVSVSQSSTVFIDPTASTVVLPTVPGVPPLPEEDAFFLGFMLLLSPEELSCLATGVSGATAEDDAAAIAILERCGVSIAFTLDMLIYALIGDSADSAASTLPPATIAATAPAVTVPAVTAPAVSVPLPPTSAGAISPDDPMVDQFQQMLLEQQGVTLDDVQAACLLTHTSAGTVDPSEMQTILEVMELCGISVTDLVPN
jgi:hypothetical protein